MMLCICLVSSTFFSWSQEYGRHLSVTTQISYTNGCISLNWENPEGVATEIFRKRTNQYTWKSINVNNASTFNDCNIDQNTDYEYKIERTNIRGGANGYATSYGYSSISTSSHLNITTTNILILVDSALFVGLTSELTNLKQDFLNDGYKPFILPISQYLSVKEVKSIVTNYYYTNNISYLYLLGHIAVPYSGIQAPDGHDDHVGAWPADGYYGDINEENWTELFFFSHENKRDPRNTNIFQDGKYDQNTFNSNLEIIVSRVDFSRLDVFKRSELQLTKDYLSRVSNYKKGLIQSNSRALIDDKIPQDVGGFTNNIYRNFSSILGSNNIVKGEFLRDLKTENYYCAMSSSYADDTSAFGVATSSEIATNNTNAFLKFFMGSYFGDWDTPNNFLRTNLASGNTMNAIWAGRPNFFCHTLALNNSIGECFRNTCNNGLNGETAYEPTGAYPRSTSLALMGDPTLRLNYKSFEANFVAQQLDEIVQLSWNLGASAVTYDYLILYKWDIIKKEYIELAELSPLTGKYIDFNTSLGINQYLLKGVYMDNGMATKRLTYTLGKMTQIDVIPVEKKPVFPASFTMRIDKVADALQMLTTELEAIESGIYHISIAKQETDGDWFELTKRDVILSQGEVITEKFYDSLSPNITTYFQATCTYNDSAILSNKVSTKYVKKEEYLVYPNPCHHNYLNISGLYVTEKNIQIINSQGQSCTVLYNPELKKLNISGYRKGIYSVIIDGTPFTISIIH